MEGRLDTAGLFFRAAQQRGLEPTWETPSGLFSFKYKGRVEVIAYSKSILNTQLGAALSQNKEFCRIALERNGYPVIPYCRTRQAEKLLAFFDHYRPLIRKPLKGKACLDVTLVNSLSLLSEPDDSRDYLYEQFIPGTEYRYLVLSGRVIAVQRKDLSPTPDLPWEKYITNLEVTEWNNELIELATKIAATLRLGLVAVDFIVDESGQAWVLETNSGPGLDQFYYPHAGQPLDVVGQILDEILRRS